MDHLANGDSNQTHGDVQAGFIEWGVRSALSNLGP